MPVSPATDTTPCVKARKLTKAYYNYFHDQWRFVDGVSTDVDNNKVTVEALHTKLAANDM